MNIVLIGYRGSGKSAVGRALAGLMGRELVDTDALIVQEAGKTIREIFAAEGEPGFREREARAVRQAAARSDIVISAGGGAVLRPDNIAALRATGHVVWMRARAEVLLQRIQADVATSATRPNLTAGGGLDEVRTLLAKRTPLYESAAHHQIEVEGRTIDDIAASVLALLPRESGR